MYSMCTLRKRTNTVHILYIYCTYDGEGTLKPYGLAIYEVCCSIVRHSVSPCAAAAYGVPFSGLWGCKRRLRGAILQDFSLRRFFFCYSLFLTGITRNCSGINRKFFLSLNSNYPADGTQAPRLRFLTAITSNWSAIISNSLALRAL